MEQALPNKREELPLRIEKSAIQELPQLRYEGRVELIQSEEALDAAIDHLSSEAVLGFDTETRPAFRKGVSFPVSLVQLAVHDCVYIFQLNKLKNLGGLSDLFTKKKLLKVGVALHDDVKALQDLHDFKPVGFVELSSITRTWGIENTGLRSLAAIFLKGRVSKSVRVSNWARSQLTDAQITYAATDAWVALRLYERIQALTWSKA